MAMTSPGIVTYQFARTMASRAIRSAGDQTRHNVRQDAAKEHRDANDMHDPEELKHVITPRPRDLG
jgi:hypothetical protein